ncbi:MAG: hydroxyacid dehydrogenase [Candidatus Vogelbacteria bacterium RIFOXYD1_FULL_42_15]|uniref:Hydroxyacid dehydrogenase n=1 Tax=Candidatus Vogelbacteria bacterium RIFOXYD1_FULL_42_15 TaxID=1802437 RepID=A0A1G2QI28_9BACT|nr:MAG: hydroxyacid dehydrogenase [Candidatus Vogelbacteria bacterium RIFOXYD1_FULL_42_15]
MKIGFFELEQWEKDYLADKMSALGEVAMIDSILTAENLPTENDFEIISVFVNSIIDARVLDHLPNLKLVVTRSTGFDHIDLDLCKSRGVAVANVPSYGEDTVAEYTFALLLNLSRKVHLSFDRIRETGSFSLDGLRGFDLKGKTLGVIGTGRIGRNVIEIATGFNMNVVAYDPKPNAEYAAKMNYQYLELNDVLAQADIVTLHVPYTEASHHLIDAESFQRMKKGVYFLNTARGPLVDTMALVGALRSGQVAGAGLDVLEEEGVIKDELNVLTSGKLEGHDLKAVLADHLLVDMPNVIVTPHNAFNTWEALKRILDTSADNIKNFVAGSLSNLVN